MAKRLYTFMLWFIVLICAILLFFPLFSFLSGNGMSLGENGHHLIREPYKQFCFL